MTWHTGRSEKLGCLVFARGKRSKTTYLITPEPDNVKSRIRELGIEGPFKDYIGSDLDCRKLTEREHSMYFG